MKLVALKFQWWGVCIGGRHYTGSIRCGDGSIVEMIKKLSRREAKENAERQGRMWLARETDTNQFDSLAELERAAIKWCNKNCGDEWLLQHYDNLNPWYPVAGKGYIVKRLPMLRRLSKYWDKHSNNEKLCKHIYKTWFDLLKKPT